MSAVLGVRAVATVMAPWDGFCPECRRGADGFAIGYGRIRIWCDCEPKSPGKCAICGHPREYQDTTGYCVLCAARESDPWGGECMR